MALLFVDGFEHYAYTDFLKKWTGNGLIPSLVAMSTTAGRRGGGCLTFASGYPTVCATKVLPGNPATLIAGAAWDMDNNPGGAGFLAFLDSTTATTNVTLYLTASKAIAAYRGDVGTLLGTSANAVVPSTGYCHIEAKVLIHATTGTVDVRVNGVSVLSLTGQNTKQGTNAYSNTVKIGVPGSMATTGKIDDFYVCDNSGSTNNNFLGDCRVDTLFPTADGNYSAWTPNSGTVHFNRVNEAAPDLTTYDAGLTIGDRDSYGMADLASLSSQTIFGVQINAAVLKDDAGAKSICTMARSGGVDGDGASAAVSTSQQYVSQVFETDPNGAIAWTQTSVNAMEAGVKVTA